jgi:hypothetical protein
MMTAAQLLRPCPASGEGVHTWIFYAACRLITAGLSVEEAEREIEALMTRLPDPPSEIMDALRSARGDRSRSTPRWTQVNPVAIAEIVKNGPTLLELVSRSPEPIQFVPQSRTELIIDTFFPGNPWLCVGEASNRFYTARREEWRGRLDKQSLIVPSPMCAQKGCTKEGKLSCHSADNTGPRRFLITEFDSGALDQQAGLLWHLARFAPLALVVFSGSRSLHGWFFCQDQPENKLTRFFDYAHSLGACQGMWQPSQFARMPDGTRHDGKTSDALKIAGIQNVPSGRQTVLYFNPGVIR